MYRGSLCTNIHHSIGTQSRVGGRPPLPESWSEMMEMRRRAHPRTTEYVGVGLLEGPGPPLHFEKCCVTTMPLKQHKRCDCPPHAIASVYFRKSSSSLKEWGRYVLIRKYLRQTYCRTTCKVSCQPCFSKTTEQYHIFLHGHFHHTSVHICI